jgi:hypothetical protein
MPPSPVARGNIGYILDEVKYDRIAKHEVLGITGQSNSIDGIRLNQFT